MIKCQMGGMLEICRDHDRDRSDQRWKWTVIGVVP